MHSAVRVASVIVALLVVTTSAASAQSAPADAVHADWTALLAKHVRWLPGGHASQVDYRGMAADRSALLSYLKRLGDVTPAQYGAWSKPEQLAFLINAYNAATIELVLTKYPALKSIKDLGTVFESPWKQRVIDLLGARRHLDEIEHGMIRAPGVFDEPRIHVAVVCASIGCPALRPEAFTGAQLDAQLEDAMRRFMADRSRNRFNPQSGKAELSKIFDWYGKDFERGHRGFGRLDDVLARYADQLADAPDDRARLHAGGVPIRFLDYDWRLNDSR